MKRLLSILLICLFPLIGIYAKGERRTVVFDVQMHCQNCVNKIEKNSAFERGVKDLLVDLKAKQVTVVYDPQKTDIPTLQQAFEKIGKPAKVHTAPTDTKTKPTEEVDASSSASIPNAQ